MDDLTSLAARPLLVLGEALVDEFADGPVAGGAPLNVARSLRALGLETHFATRLNPDDAAGEMLLASMRRFGLSLAGVQADTVHASGRVSVHESGHGGHRFQIHRNVAWDHLEAPPILEWLGERNPGLVYAGSLARRHPESRATLERVLAAFSATGGVRYLDLNLRAGSDRRELAEACLAAADWVKVNDEELQRLADWFELPAPSRSASPETTRCAHALMRRFGLRRLVVTLGEQGYVGFNGDSLPVSGPAQPLLRRVDTVGAGDAFSAMLVASLLRGRSWAQALELANGMAGAMCGERGPAPANLSFYAPWRAFLEQ
ncbi:PfkB family carbohydrate kinase [Roseateles sp. SL47]|uniref:PfkB family carbohydrate kinase n=1 Tax=Roseateles sp. SL47 TaxID=2995138 RepID=UPI00226E5186|nr:PfkB family carbohydrate kinase [Roseateles sp. SL47]WAC71573.1 PfkB family carbohydrate kinase [Roseateles sp. SL47]